MPWGINFHHEQPKPKKIPVCVDLPRLPLAFRPFIHKIDVTLGEVQEIDSNKFLSIKPHPQVCVVMDSTDALPSCIWVKMENDIGYEQPVRIRGFLDSCF